MIPWKTAYERCLKSGALTRSFGREIPEGNFLLRAFSLRFTNDVNAPVPSGVALAVSPTIGTYGPVSGPVLRTFVSGAIILGITATAMQIQTAAGGFGYGPQGARGRLDLFGLNFSMTNSGNMTATGMTQASSLLSTGNNDGLFPGREIVLPPAQGMLVSAANLNTVSALSVTVVFHAAVPRNN